MKPKPFSALNHLTVPCAICFSLHVTDQSDVDRLSGFVDECDMSDTRSERSQDDRLPWDRYDTNSRTVTRNQYSMTRTEHRIRGRSPAQNTHPEQPGLRAESSSVRLRICAAQSCFAGIQSSSSRRLLASLYS